MQAASSQAQDAGAGLPAQQRPVVVIVPAVEGLPPRSMQDFILVVSEVGPHAWHTSRRLQALPDLHRDKLSPAALLRSA